MWNKRKFIINEIKKPGVDRSRWFLIPGCTICGVAMVTALLALTLPYWIYVEEVMETTVAGLKDATDVTYFFGLLRYCLKMKATHLDRDECKSNGYSTLSDWEQTTLVTFAVSIPLSALTIAFVVCNLRFWNKLVFLILATVTALASGICQAVGVSLYQIKASVLVLDIGGLTTANFKAEFLSVSFWFGFISAFLTLVAGLLLMFDAFTWRKPKKMRRNIYKTTVRAPRCPYKGRTPGIMTISQM